MRKRARFYFLHKLPVLNVLLMAWILIADPRLLQQIEDKKTFHYYIGVALIGALFLEFGAIYYKARLIYSSRTALDKKVPWFLQFSILPRLFISGMVMGIALEAMGFLDISDFLLLPITLYAAVKEFWVRGALMRPQEKAYERKSPRMQRIGEVMMFIFICIVYSAFWEIWLIDSKKILLKSMDPQNYVFVAALFLLVLSALETPYLVEEYLRTKKKSDRIISWLSMLLPTLALLFQLFRMGYLKEF